MLLWILDNLATIIICGVLIAIVFAVIFSMIRNKKKGKTSCGCSNCPMSDSCHNK